MAKGLAVGLKHGYVVNTIEVPSKKKKSSARIIIII